jgi:ABC-type taurine transport system ATPase subunit
MQDSLALAQRGTIMAVLGCTALSATYFLTLPAGFSTDTAGTSSQWKKLCSDPAQACQLVKSENALVTYRACGSNQCYIVTCVAGFEDKVCDKRALADVKPPPRKLRTIVGSIL